MRELSNRRNQEGKLSKKQSYKNTSTTRLTNEQQNEQNADFCLKKKKSSTEKYWLYDSNLIHVQGKSSFIVKLTVNLWSPRFI